MNPETLLQDVAGIPALDLSSWLGAFGVFGAAWGLGWLIWRLRPLPIPTVADETAIHLSIGLAVLPTLVLMLGQIPGLLVHPVVHWAGLGLGVLFIALTARALVFIASRASSQRHTGKPSEEPPAARWIGRALYLLLALALLNLLFVQSAPPVAYDTLEYHLGVVPHYFEASGVEPIPHVFYTAQPIATEQLYFLAGVFEGLPRGLAPGKLQWLLILLTSLLAVRVALAAGVPAPLAPALALLLLDHPIMVLLEVDRMTDITGVVFLLAAWLVWLSAGRTPPADSNAATEAPPSTHADPAIKMDTSSNEPALITARSWYVFLILGLLAGAAISTKWTNAGTAAMAIILPPLLWIITGAVRSRSSPPLTDHPNQSAILEDRPPALSPAKALRLVAAGAAGILLILVPWSAWIWSETGNPIAPFGASLFPTPRWDAARGAWLLATHGPLSPLSVEYWMNLMGRLAAGRTGMWPFAAAATLLLASWLLNRRSERAPLTRPRKAADLRKRNADDEPRPPDASTTSLLAPRTLSLIPAGLLSFLIASLLWGRLEHAALRFLAPIAAVGIVLLGLALALLLRRLPRQALTWTQIALALIILLPLLPGFARPTVLYPSWPHIRYATGGDNERTFMRQMLGLTGELFYAANELPEDARILSIGEARRYYFRQSITLATVFDVHPIRPFVMEAQSPADLERRLAAAGYTHLLVNEFEIARLLDFHPPPVLEADPEFMQLRAQKDVPAMLAQYGGFAEFGTDPLPPDRRRLYTRFLERMKGEARFLQGSPTGSPAMWIAPLGAEEPAVSA